MVTLFLGLCGAAGIASEKTTQPRKRPRLNPQEPAKHYPQKKQGKGVSTDIPAPLAGLLASLPPEGQGWTQDQRKKFIDTFGVVLDYCFPKTENGAPGQEQDSEKDKT